MKQILSVFLLGLSLSASAQNESIKLSCDVWPPFTNVEEEKTLAIDIVKTALDRINVASTYVVTDFKAVQEGFQSGTFDGSPALWKSEDREQSMIFSEAYLENQLILVGRKGTDLQYSSFAALKNQRIGLVKDYAYGDSLKKVPGLQVVYGVNDQENLVNLLSNKVDLMLVDALLIQYLLKYELNDVSELLEFAETPLIIKPLHLALSKELANAEKIISAFNAEIKEMLSDGTYNTLLGLDWIRVDVDGDGKLELVFNGEAAGTEAPDNSYGVYYSDAGNTNQFYIGGKYYNSWEEVPDKYKVKIPPPEGADAYDYGMTIKF